MTVKNIPLDEAVSLKRVVEHGIYEILREYYKKTGMLIKCVDVEYITPCMDLKQRHKMLKGCRIVFNDTFF